MDEKNPFNPAPGNEAGNDDADDASVEPPREIETVPRSIWATAIFILLMAMLGFAGYSLVELRKRSETMLDELERRRAVIEQAEARALQAETRNFTLNNNLEKTQAEKKKLQDEAGKLESTRRSLEQEKQELIKARDEAARVQQTLKEEMLEALESRDVTISELQGNLTLNILDRILFDSGQAIIKPEGQTVLKEIGGLLDQVPNRQIHVLGHTDNVPIHTSMYPSNWELSAARALSAVRFLVDQGGVDPKRIAAVAHGEFQPIAPNDSAEGRARNRRITIVVLPEVFSAPEEFSELPPDKPEAETPNTTSTAREVVPVESNESEESHPAPAEPEVSENNQGTSEPEAADPDAVEESSE